MSLPSVCPSVHPRAGHPGGCLDPYGGADSGRMPRAHSYGAWEGVLEGEAPPPPQRGRPGRGAAPALRKMSLGRGVQFRLRGRRKHMVSVWAGISKAHTSGSWKLLCACWV